MTNASVLRPQTLSDALEALASKPAPTVIAGGTDIMPAIRSGKHAPPLRWLALDEVQGLATITAESGGLRVGASATHAAISKNPLVDARAAALRDLSGRLGSPATRAWGTLGGTLGQASRSMDAAGPLLVFNADIELASLRAGRRRVAFTHFTRSPRRRDLDDDELIVAIHLGPAPDASAFIKLAVRRTMDVATVTASAALITADGQTIDDVRLAVGGLGTSARRLPALERKLRGISRDQCSALVRGALDNEPRLDTDRRVADDYRRAVAASAVTRAIKLAFERTNRDTQ